MKNKEMFSFAVGILNFINDYKNGDNIDYSLLSSFYNSFVKIYELPLKLIKKADKNNIEFQEGETQWKTLERSLKSSV